MEIKDEFKKINIKNRTCYHFDDIIEMLIIVIFYWTKKYVKKITKIFNLWHFIQKFIGFKTNAY